jgi:hypothetical protein
VLLFWQVIDLQRDRDVDYILRDIERITPINCKNHSRMFRDIEMGYSKSLPLFERFKYIFWGTDTSPEFVKDFLIKNNLIDKKHRGINVK